MNPQEPEQGAPPQLGTIPLSNEGLSDIPGFGPLSPEHKAQGWVSGQALADFIAMCQRQKSDNRKKERFGK